MLITPESLKGVFAVLMCLALIVWSAVPSFTHSPAVLETIQDHLEMVEDHGHSHGFEEDLYWAMHGHSHDTADHDHNPAYLLTGRNADPAPETNKIWRPSMSQTGSSRKFRIDRPPRT